MIEKIRDDGKDSFTYDFGSNGLLEDEVRSVE